MALQIGITGGMGAGKSLIANMFSLLGVPIYDSDHAARSLMVTDDQLVFSIKELLGDEAYDKHGNLNRAYVGNKIFNDYAMAAALEAKVHPAVHEDARRWHASHTDKAYTLREAALLYESGSYLHLDAVINVAAPETVRVARVMDRDQLSETEVRARLKRQWSESQRALVADYTITNDGNRSIIPQVWKLHGVLLAGCVE